MRFFILTLLVCWTLSLTAPHVLIAGPFLSPFAQHSVSGPRIGAYPPLFEKNTVPRHWRHGHYPFPYYVFYRGTKPYQERTRPPRKTVYKEPIVLNPEIFNPSPKTPLTLVIEDGVIVDSYLGY